MISKIIKISAAWCAPCRAFAPIFDKVSEMEDYKSIKFEKIDPDDSTTEEQNLMLKYNVRNIPTTLYFDENDKLLDKTIGSLSEAQFISKIGELNKNNETKKEENS